MQTIRIDVLGATVAGVRAAALMVVLGDLVCLRGQPIVSTRQGTRFQEKARTAYMVVEVAVRGDVVDGW